MTQKNIGNSVNNIQVTENILSKEEHKELLDYVTSIDHWKVQPWGVKVLPPQEMPKEIGKMLDKVFMLAYKKCIELYDVKLYPLIDIYNRGVYLLPEA